VDMAARSHEQKVEDHNSSFVHSDHLASMNPSQTRGIRFTQKRIQRNYNGWYVRFQLFILRTKILVGLGWVTYRSLVGGVRRLGG
jgi:hypothetical protein